MNTAHSGIPLRLAETETPFSRLGNFFRALLRTVKVRRRERMLRIAETLPLGEKRFLAVVQFENRRFLIAATPQSVSLLERLDSPSVSAEEAEGAVCSPSTQGIQ